jgi:hypothetical protein
MVRTDRHKYCVYSRGNQRESLVDLKNDPGELKDLATNPEYRNVLVEHRALLAKYGQQHNDPLVAELLAKNVQPRPFTAEANTPSQPEKKKKPGNTAKRIAETNAQ